MKKQTRKELEQLLQQINNDSVRLKQQKKSIENILKSFSTGKYNSATNPLLSKKSFPTLSEEKREQRNKDILYFMSSQGGKNIPSKDIAKHLKETLHCIYAHMRRKAKKPNCPWKHGDKRTHFSSINF